MLTLVCRLPRCRTLEAVQPVRGVKLEFERAHVRRISRFWKDLATVTPCLAVGQPVPLI